MKFIFAHKRDIAPFLLRLIFFQLPFLALKAGVYSAQAHDAYAKTLVGLVYQPHPLWLT